MGNPFPQGFAGSNPARSTILFHISGIASFWRWKVVLCIEKPISMITHIYSNIRICLEGEKDEHLENNNHCRGSVYGCSANNGFSFRLMVVF